MKTFSPLLEYRDNLYSQNGEDGILAEMINRLNIENIGWVCEFGAWDGKHLSNTFALAEKGWKAVYIEGDPKKYPDLLDTARSHDNIIPIQEFVTRGGLDSILEKTAIPYDFTLLSIDIDSYDLEVWEGLKNYKPIVVVIEINSSIPPGVMHRHSDQKGGNSFSSTVEVGKSKGYDLVCHTGNLIFLDRSYVTQLNLPAEIFINPEALFLSTWLGDRPKGLFEKVTGKLKIFLGRND